MHQNRTNQLKDCIKSGVWLLRDRCRITSLETLTMTLPPPSHALSISCPITTEHESPPLKVKGRVLGCVRVCVRANMSACSRLRSCKEDLRLFHRANLNRHVCCYFI